MLPPGIVDYSIAAVSKLTGVSCHALRVWERRYGFPLPNRSATGHRRYSKEQVTALRDLATRLLVGHPVGELIALYREGRAGVVPSLGDRSSGTATTLVLPELLAAGDLAGAEAVLDRFEERMSPLELIEEIIEPVLIEVGDRSYRRESLCFQDRLASVCLLNRLHHLLDLARRSNRTPRRRVLVGTVEGESHEGGYLMACLALELAGWRAIPLGAELPVRALQDAVLAWKPDAVALSFELSRNITKRFAELAQIRSVPVFVGGRSIVNHLSLARRLGLIPLTGPVSSAVAQLILDFERWYCDRPQGQPLGSVAPGSTSGSSEP